MLAERRGGQNTSNKNPSKDVLSVKGKLQGEWMDKIKAVKDVGVSAGGVQKLWGDSCENMKK